MKDKVLITALGFTVISSMMQANADDVILGFNLETVKPQSNDYINNSLGAISPLLLAMNMANLKTGI